MWHPLRLAEDFATGRHRHEGLPPSVPYRGYELRELTLVPRPLRQPVECWQPVVSASARGLDFMMKHCIKGLIGGGAATMAGRSINAYQEASERAGLSYKLGEGLSVPGLTPEQNAAAMGRGGWAVVREGGQARLHPLKAAKHLLELKMYVWTNFAASGRRSSSAIAPARHIQFSISCWPLASRAGSDVPRHAS